MNVEVIEPHGFCAGVNAAIAKAFALKNAYFLHGLVHSEIIVEGLKALGHSFVERVEDVPDGATVVFSAHGVSPSVRKQAKQRRLNVIDTTCPFVAKVHEAARRFSSRRLPVVVIGDPKHVEVRGIVGEDGSIHVLNPHQPSAVSGLASSLAVQRIGVVSQTTMNADDVAKLVGELKGHYDVETMAEVCTATKERQDAVKAFCRGKTSGLGVLVLGSRMSSNARRLAEVSERAGVRTFLVGTMEALGELDFSGIRTLGVTSGASTPEQFFDEAIGFLRQLTGDDRPGQK